LLRIRDLRYTERRLIDAIRVLTEIESSPFDAIRVLVK
jgi:hypothetical protein